METRPTCRVWKPDLLVCMAKILFFNVPTTGHVDPSLPVAGELAKRGHQVDYFLTAAYRERVESTGSTFHAYEGIGPDYFEGLIQRFNPVRLATQLVETSIRILPSLGRAVAQLQPQVIVYDSMCPWGRIAAKQAGVPAVASMALLDLPLSYMFKNGKWWTALPVMIGVLPWLPGYLQAAGRLQKAAGVSVPAFARLLNWPGDHNLCYTARSILPGAPSPEAGYTFVGPPTRDVAAEVPFPFDELDPDLPLIYVSLGTVFNRAPGFFRACLEGLSGSAFQVVVSTGNGVAASELAPIPENAIVRNYVPQGAILARASLFISHSGANSVHQALLNGVPLLLVPQQVEQAMTAARLEELGVALSLNRQEVNPESIGRLAERLLSDSSFRLKAEALGEELNQAGGASRAAEVVETFFRK